MSYSTQVLGARPSPFFSLFIEGTEQEEAILRRVKSIVIRHQHKRAQTATVIFTDETLDLVDQKIFAKNSEWTILLGLRSDFQPFGPYSVESYQMNFGADGIATITVQLMDITRKLARSAQYRRFSGLSIGQVVKQIADEHGLGYEIENSEEYTFNDEFPMMQAGVSDAMLLRQMADRFGYRFQIENNSIVFKQSQVNQDSNLKTLAWKMGDRNLKSFLPAQKTYGGKGVKGKLNAAQTGAKVKAGGVDIPKGKGFEVDFFGKELLESLGSVSSVESTEGGAFDIDMDGGEGTAPESTAEGTGKEDKSTLVFDPESGEFKPVEPTKDNEKAVVDAKDVGTDPPQTEQEAKKTLGASKAGTASDLAIARAMLTYPDVRVRSGDWFEVVGVSRRFSGRWRCVEFEHTLNPSSGLNTVLGLTKKGLGSSSYTTKAEDKAAKTEAGPPNSGRDEGTSPAEATNLFDPETGTWNNKTTLTTEALPVYPFGPTGDR